jgi:hypothetical protein
MNTRDNFKTDTQYKRWLDYVEFFTKIIDMQNKGKTIWVEYEDGLHILGKIEFTKCDNQWHIFEIYSSQSKTWWVGDTHDYNKSTEDYDLLYIDNSIKQLIKKYKFKYFANEVLIK